MTEWYPVMLDISGRLCVVVGGGPVAERKTRGLLEAGARVLVVSPELSAGLRRLADEGELEWRPRAAADSDLEGAVLVFAAAGDPGANRAVASAARGIGVPVNVADDGVTGDFIVPAVLRRGPFVLTSSVSGAGPALASRVIRELSGRYGPEYAEYAEILRRIRDIVKRSVPDPHERRILLTAAAEADALEEWRLTARTADSITDAQWLVQRLRSRAAATQEEDKS